MTPTLRSAAAALGLLAPYRAARDRIALLRARGTDEFTLELDELRVRFPLQDDHARLFFHRLRRSGGLYEPAVSRELVERARQARVFFDVGAHLGWFGCLAAAANPRLDVHCFEMNERLVPMIRAAAARNGFTGLRTVHAAVTEIAGACAYPAGSVRTGLGIVANGAGEEVEKVAGLALDDYCQEQGVWPDLVKLDVEGAEGLALRGARRLLTEHHPVLFLEVHARKLPAFGDDAAGVLMLLASHGYAVRRFAAHRRGEGALVPLLSLRELTRNDMVLAT